jgi:hypothetical protein
MNLGVAVMASGYAVISSGSLNLLIFYPAEFQACILIAGLEKTTTASAAEIIGMIRIHVNKVFFSNTGLDNIAKIFGNGVTIAFAYNLARILGGKFNLEVLVPVRIDL